MYLLGHIFNVLFQILQLILIEQNFQLQIQLFASVKRTCAKLVVKAVVKKVQLAGSVVLLLTPVMSTLQR